MSTLDDWAEDLGKIDFIIVEKRFLKLIELVRAKDKLMADACSEMRQFYSMWYRDTLITAIAFTDSLGEGE